MPSNESPARRDPPSIRSYLAKVRARTKSLRFRKKQVIFAHGEHSDSIFYVEEGSVKLTVTSEDGHEALVAVRAPGAFFGDSAIAKDPPRRSNNAIALTESRVLEIDRDAMRFLIRTEPEVADAVISSLIEKQAEIQDRMTNSLLYSGERQLAQALVTLSQLRDGIPEGHIPTLSQQELANMIGMTRQRINVILRGFRESGFIGPGLRVDPSIETVLRGHSSRSRP